MKTKLVFLILIFASCSSPNVTTVSSVDSSELSSVIASGQQVYVTHCQECHTSTLSGDSNWKTGKDEDGHRLPPPLNGYGHSWHHSPEQIFNTVKHGLIYFDPNYEGKMNGNSKLTDQEIWSVIEYIYSIWPEEIQVEYATRHNLNR